MRFDHPLVPLLGRLLIVYIFATSGLGKIMDWQGNVQYMNTRHLPAIPLLLGIATIVEVGGSLCLITGYGARIAAFIMFIYMIGVTMLFHNYWAAAGNPPECRRPISEKTSPSWATFSCWRTPVPERGRWVASH